MKLKLLVLSLLTLIAIVAYKQYHDFSFTQATPPLTSSPTKVISYTSTNAKLSLTFPEPMIVTEQYRNVDPVSNFSEIVISTQAIESDTTPSLRIVYGIPYIDGKGGGCDRPWEQVTILDQSVNVCHKENFRAAGYPKHPSGKIEYWFVIDGQPTVAEEDYYRSIMYSAKFTTESTKAVDDSSRLIKLYYHDRKLDPNFDSCDVNNYLETTIPRTASPIKDAVNALLSSSVLEHNDEFILKSINLKSDGTLVLEFPFIGGFTTGGSCRIGLLTSQIEKTAKQFTSVKNVVFEPNVFQP
ncbi:MAG: GerMN domain-containing protein [bacterium]